MDLQHGDQGDQKGNQQPRKQTMSDNDEYIEMLEKKISSLEEICNAHEQEFFALLEVIKDIRMMNSYGKTKEIADEIDTILTHHNQ
jgi:hypothetical protein